MTLIDTPASSPEVRDPAETMNLRVSGVTKSYLQMNKRHVVFRDLTLDFPRGKSVGVIGPNGSGKSTLLRLMAGAEVPDSGVVRRYARMSWPVGFSGAVNAGMSAVANARFCARIYDRDPDDVVDFTREFSGLNDFMTWPLSAVSSGMRARFAFSLSMAIDFQVLLIDEVLSVGDVEFRAKCAEALEMRRATSDTILVSHNLKDVIRLCDRVIVLGGEKPIVSDDVLRTVKQYSVAIGGSVEAMEY